MCEKNLEGNLNVSLPHGARLLRVVEERVKLVPKPQYCNRVVQVSKTVPRDKIVEVPNIEIKEIYQEQAENVRDTEFYDPAIHEGQPSISYTDVDRYIPVPIEEITTYEYKVSKFEPTVTKVKYPLYVPRFIEVPLPTELIPKTQVDFTKSLAAKLSHLRDPNVTSYLNDVENITSQAQKVQEFVNFQDANSDNLVQTIRQKWLQGQLNIEPQKVSALIAATVVAVRICVCILTFFKYF